ncbi:MAG: universal stress protein [Nitrospirae bacterium]|nr:universal stress protein [Nitrospirota bacterium]
MKVLCAVDGSQFSQWAVEALGALGSQRPDTVVLLHTVDTGAIKAKEARDQAKLKASLAAIDSEGNKLLQRMAQTATLALSQAATASRTKVRTVLAHGPVGETIVRQAGRRGVDLLMVGSRGLSDIRGFLLGSVSRKVVSLASRPVLVVKRRLPEMTRVVLAIDGSKHSRAAAEFLRDRLLPESAHLTVLSVVAPIVTDIAASVLPPSQLERLTKPREDQARQLVAAFREMYLKEGYAVSSEVLSGHPSQAILQHAERTQADLIVVGSRGLAGTERLLLGSVSEGVVKYAPCSVMVVRGGQPRLSFP